MAENIKCDYCDNQATVHLTTIINNEVNKIDLCEDCAQQKGVSSNQGISLSDVFTGATSDSGAASGLACKVCGFTHSDFRANGRFGCPACYKSFRPILQETLENMHPGTHHVGKVPNQLLERMDSRDRETELEEVLQQAIAEENYEEAAKIRDQLNELRTADGLAAATGQGK
jgi:protein arginine kinase activator